MRGVIRIMKEMKRAEKTLALLKRGRGVNDFMGTRPLSVK
jgi:hypothetical protein